MEKDYLKRSCTYVLQIPLAETIKEFVSFILKGVDLIDHTSILAESVPILATSPAVQSFTIIKAVLSNTLHFTLPRLL